MIDRLVSYARSEGLIAEPGFTPKEVKWAVDISDGRYAGLLSLGDPELKRHSGRRFPCCPDLSQPELTVFKGAGTHFLVAACDQVALYPEPDPRKREGCKTLQKHAFFIRLLRDASEDVPQLAAAASVLEDPSVLEKLRADLAAHKAKATDRITVRIDGDFPVESDAWHPWWRRFRMSIAKRKAETGKRPSQGRPMVCLATGQLVEPEPTHPKISGLVDVGGQSAGSVLIGYDKAAFRSYGLSQSENGAMSAETATAYREALNHLLSHHSRKLVGAKVVHWYQGRAKVEKEEDPIAWLDEPPEEEREQEALQQQESSAAQRRAAELLDALRTGKRPDLLDSRYCALTLSGSGGRVMVREWMEGAFEELVSNVNAWFNDFSIVRRDGTGLTSPPKFLAVLASTARELNDVPAPHASVLWQAAVNGRPIPRQVMALALARVRIALIRDDPVSHAGMGLLKAYHIRKGGMMTPYLNEEHPEPAYHCGRLMALLARVQYAALGDVGAGLVQRYYAAASATPALVLGRLIRTSQFHLNKLEPGLAYWHETRIAQVWGRIRDRVPAVLSLEEQSLFALGYYQQLAFDRSTSPTSNQKENNHA